MIRIPHKDNNSNPSKDIQIRSLDQLVEFLRESYDIPSSEVEIMRSGLEDALSAYLNEFLSAHSYGSSQSVEISINEGIDRIIETIRFNDKVVLLESNSPLIKFENGPDFIRYEFLGLDPSDISSDVLIESWNSQDASGLRPLLEFIINRRR